MEIRLGANAQEDLAAAIARAEDAEKELAAISDLLTNETYARYVQSSLLSYHVRHASCWD